MKLEYNKLVSGSKWAPFILVWKRNCVDKGYYEDDFVKYFTIKTHMSSTGNLFMYLRVMAIRKVITTFLEYFRGQKVQFVNLGCGLDSTSLWVLKNFDNATCFDLDLEHQIKLKLEVFSKTKEILSLFSDYEATEYTFKSSRYNVFPCDFRNVDELRKLKEFGFSNELPTIYLSEFVLTYIENHLSNKVINKCSTMTNSPSIFVFFEFTNPSSFFAKWYFPIVQQYNVNMYSFDEYPTFESQYERFKSLGWDDAFFRHLNFAYNYMIDKNERKRVRSIENFNDMLTLAQFCNHFVIGVACKNLNEYKNFLERFKEYELNNDDIEDELMLQFDPKDLQKEFDIVPLQEFIQNILDNQCSISSEEQKAFYERHSITS